MISEKTNNTNFSARPLMIVALMLGLVNVSGWIISPAQRSTCVLTEQVYQASEDLGQAIFGLDLGLRSELSNRPSIDFNLRLTSVATKIERHLAVATQGMPKPPKRLNTQLKIIPQDSDDLPQLV